MRDWDLADTNEIQYQIVNIGNGDGSWHEIFPVISAVLLLNFSEHFLQTSEFLHAKFIDIFS